MTASASTPHAYPHNYCAHFGAEILSTNTTPRTYILFFIRFQKKFDLVNATTHIYGACGGLCDSGSAICILLSNVNKIRIN
jgi:hypothetical protein